MRHYLSAAVLLVSLSAVARADGLLYKLSEDGSWVRFKMEYTLQVGGMDQSSEGAVTMSSVGAVKENDQPLRWIEFKLEPENDKEVVKLLVPEKHLKGGEDPLTHVARAWIKRANSEAEPLADPAGHDALKVLLAGPLKDLKKLDKQTVESKLGKLECEGLTGQTHLKSGNEEVDVTYTVRLHDRAPFGVV